LPCMGRPEHSTAKRQRVDRNTRCPGTFLGLWSLRKHYPSAARFHFSPDGDIRLYRYPPTPRIYNS
jgi:hypothetical protein